MSDEVRDPGEDSTPMTDDPLATWLRRMAVRYERGPWVAWDWQAEAYALRAWLRESGRGALGVGPHRAQQS